MPNSSGPNDWSAREIAQRIARREISAVEVTRAFLDRIEAVNPRINALVVPRFEEALADAAAIDARLAGTAATAGPSSGAAHDAGPSSGAALPLLGVPITVKECFHLAGTPSTIGLNNPEHRQIIKTDGILVQRLKRAGAIVLGKTNLPQLMIWHESDNPVYGRTNNPWNLARTCGGSSGGEAAIIAARGSPLGLGNDLGGSIRIPAHFCGICGLRPTSYRLPRGGAARTLHGFEAIVTQPGPLARRTDDLWLALEALCDRSDGYVAGDVPPIPLGDPARVELPALKIAAWTDDGVFPPSPAVARAVREAVGALRAKGAEVIELGPAEVQSRFHASEAFDLYCGLLGADGAANALQLARGSTLDPRVWRLTRIAGLTRPLRRLAVAGLRSFGQHSLARIVEQARPRSAADFWRLVERKNRLAAGVLSWLREEGVSAIVCPPHALPAPPHVKAFDLLLAASYALLINLLGFPSGTVPMTRVRPDEQAGRLDSRDRALKYARETDQSSEGLPVGVQVAALPWREEVVAAILKFLEQSTAVSDQMPTACIAHGE